MRTTREMASKRQRARYMLVVKGYSQKEAARLVGVSENSMCKWAKKFDWHDKSQNEAFKQGGFDVIMEGFFSYVKQVSPSISANISSLWAQYLKTLEDEYKQPPDG